VFLTIREVDGFSFPFSFIVFLDFPFFLGIFCAKTNLLIKQTC